MHSDSSEQIVAQTYAWLSQIPPYHGDQGWRSLAESIQGVDDYIGKHGSEWEAYAEPLRASYLQACRNLGAEATNYCQFLAGKMHEFWDVQSDSQTSISRDVALGDGRHGNVYDATVRGARAAYKPAGVSESDVYAYYLTQGISHTPELIGVDLNTHQSLMTYLSGKRYDELTKSERDGIPQQHIGTAVETVLAIARAGASIDSIGVNLLYDPDDGYNFVDLMYSRGVGVDNQRVVDQLGRFTRILLKAPNERLSTAEKTQRVLQVMAAVAAVSPEIFAEIQQYMATTYYQGDFHILGFHTSELERGREYDRFCAELAQIKTTPSRNFFDRLQLKRFVHI